MIARNLSISKLEKSDLEGEALMRHSRQILPALTSISQLSHGACCGSRPNIETASPDGINLLSRADKLRGPWLQFYRSRNPGWNQVDGAHESMHAVAVALHEAPAYDCRSVPKRIQGMLMSSISKKIGVHKRILRTLTCMKVWKSVRPMSYRYC